MATEAYFREHAHRFGSKTTAKAITMLMPCMEKALECALQLIDNEDNIVGPSGV